MISKLAVDSRSAFFSHIILAIGLISSCTSDSSPAGGPIPVEEEELYEFMFSIFDDEQQYDTVQNEFHLSGQLLIRDCMLTEGFEYVPFVDDFKSDTALLADDDFAKIYGFGYSTEILPTDEETEDFCFPNHLTTRIMR